MKINVPFYKSKKDTECGPVVLKMVLEYFGEKYEIEKLAKMEKQIKTGLVWSLGIARAARKLGFPVKIISTSNFSHENEDIDYCKKYKGNKGIIVLEELKKEVEELGIESEEKNLSLEKLLSYISKESVPIVLVDWNVLKNKDGYQGHFLIVTGYDNKNVYVHNPGIANAMAFMPIKKEIFLKSWESKGTDKDTIVIYRKTKA